MASDIKRFWLSWNQPGDDSRPIAGGDAVGPWLLGWWESGVGEGYTTVVAWVEAPTERKAWERLAQEHAWPEVAEAERRFSNEVARDWRPTDRFPIPAWSRVQP